jgi:hypothetical protein
MTEVRKRQALTRMKYDRVDLVAEGANAHAHILLAKNRKPAPKTLTVRKAMGQIKCNHCGMMNAKGAQKCKRCGSSDLAKTRIVVTKTVTNLKNAPKNDDSTNSPSNASGYTFEDEQYDQDNGENGEALGGSIEDDIDDVGGDSAKMSKSNSGASRDGWFEDDIEKADAGSGESVDTVDNEALEHQKEGEDDDSEIEQLAETKPVSLKRPPNPGSGYTNTATSSSDSTMATHKSRADFGKKKRLKKTAENPGLNSYDLTDGGSQVVTENAEHMYRHEADPTVPAQTRLESTMSDANRPLRIGKARRKKTNREGLDIMDHGTADGIYTKPGVKRNGVGTGHNKYTTKPRTAVAPPPNPLDKSRRMSPEQLQKGLVAVEAANLAVRLAKNLVAIHDKDRPDLYPAVVEDFLDVLNAGAQEWFAGSSITKSSSLGTQVENVATEVYELLSKASPASEMSDEASEGVDADKMDSVATNSMGRLKTTTRANKNEKVETVVGKNKKLYKSVAQSGEDSIEVELDPVLKGRLDMLEDLLEEREQNKYISKARELRGIPGWNEEKVAKQLRVAYETDPEMGAELEQMLAASANVVNDSAVLKQYGMTGAGSLGDDDMNAKVAKAYAAADDQIRKSNGEGVTREQAAVQYMKDHPGEFYQEAKQLR